MGCCGSKDDASEAQSLLEGAGSGGKGSPTYGKQPNQEELQQAGSFLLTYRPPAGSDAGEEAAGDQLPAKGGGASCVPACGGPVLLRGVCVRGGLGGATISVLYDSVCDGTDGGWVEGWWAAGWPGRGGGCCHCTAGSRPQRR